MMDGGHLKTLYRWHGGDLKTLSREHGGIFGLLGKLLGLGPGELSSPEMPLQRTQKIFFLLSLNEFFFSSRNMQPVRAYGRYPHAVFLVPFQKMYSTSTHSALWPWKVKKYPLQKTKPCSWKSSNHSAKRSRAGRQKIQQVRMYGPYKTSVFPNTSPLSSALFAGVSW